jgi:hypothetical protein
MTAPVPMRWTGEAMEPLKRFSDICDRQFVIGELYLMAPVEERSEASHKHEFAWLREAWQNLPDHLASEYPSPEVLRKKALIATGWCTIRDYPCVNRKEAARLAKTLEAELDAYAVVIVAQDVVRVCRARSQAKNKMRAEEFTASKNAVLDWVSNLIGVDPADLRKADAA